jgi:leader peptidase (prepilin peptidase)/N-methyltransferase
MPTFLVIPLLLIAGFIIGMAVNYLSDVLPANRRLSAPVCMGCLAPRSWKDFLTFQPCRNCSRKATFRYFLMPVIFMGLLVYFYYFPSQRFGLWPSIFLLAYFGVVLVNDIEYRVVLFPVSLAGLVIAAVYGYFQHGVWMTLLGGAVGFVIMYLFYLGGTWFTKFLSKRRGEEIDEVALGFGDVSISAVIGLLLGWPAVTAGLVLGVIAGGIFSGLYLLIMVVLKKYQSLTALPYTPFLVLGALILLFMRF